MILVIMHLGYYIWHQLLNAINYNLVNIHILISKIIIIFFYHILNFNINIIYINMLLYFTKMVFHFLVKFD